LVGTTYSFTGTPYSYTPSDGDLVMEVLVDNQDNVPNGASNGYSWADYTGTDVLRAYIIGPGQCGDLCNTTELGALVTQFNAVPLPAALPLFAGDVGALGVFSRWRRKRAGTALAV
jgi:hypothetical protein